MLQKIMKYSTWNTKLFVTVSKFSSKPGLSYLLGVQDRKCKKGKGIPVTGCEGP
jgi:hypothetical protein